MLHASLSRSELSVEVVLIDHLLDTFLVLSLNDFLHTPKDPSIHEVLTSLEDFHIYVFSVWASSQARSLLNPRIKIGFLHSPYGLLCLFVMSLLG